MRGQYSSFGVLRLLLTNLRKIRELAPELLQDSAATDLAHALWGTESGDIAGPVSY